MRPASCPDCSAAHARCSLDHLYTTSWFLGLNGLLAASLAACSYTTQWPQLKVARKWRFAASPASLARMEVHDILPRASAADLARALAARQYQVFSAPGGRVYAFKGIIGKMAPLAVHAGLLLSMGGFLASALGGAVGSAMAPVGSSFNIGEALRPASGLTLLPPASRLRIAVDAFRVSYYPNGVVSQFTSDLSVVDGEGSVLAQQEMKVNVPLRYGGVTAYQTDWAIASASVHVGGPEGTPLTLPMASLEGKQGFSGRIWGTVVPLPGDAGRATLVARDFQSVAFYDADGAFVGVRRPGSGKAIRVGGVDLLADSLSGSSGLELKVDPGVPFVYAGFAAVMLSSFLAFVSFSQVWGQEAGGTLHVGGRTTKQKEALRDELEAICASLPEYVEE